MKTLEELHYHPANPQEINDLVQRFGIEPIVAELLIQRGLTDDYHVENLCFPEKIKLGSPMDLPDMATALALVDKHLHGEAKAFVYGDYDADGVCSTVLLVEGLKAIGFEVQFYSANRFKDGYGVSAEVVREAAKEGYKLFFSIDCGSSAIEAFEVAEELSMDTVVLDHHKVPSPCAMPTAHVNPLREECCYPWQEMCGCAVGFHFLRALKEQGYDLNPMDWVDLVAVATVTDVMPFLGENRWFLVEGMKRLQSRCRPGLAALLKVSGKEPGKMSYRDIGFGIGPRLNAPGRLNSAEPVVHLLLSRSLSCAMPLAKEADEWNKKRRTEEKHVAEEAVLRLAGTKPKFIVLADESWHQGVLGIAASRLASRFKVPVMLGSVLGDTIKGSGRAPEGYNLYAMMDHCKEYFVAFGGHPRAGGFSVRRDHFDLLQESLIKAVDVIPKEVSLFKIDASVKVKDLDWNTAQALEKLAPFGEAFGEPKLILRSACYKDFFPMGVKKQHLRFQAFDEDCAISCVAFRQADQQELLENSETQTELVGTLGINSFKEQQALQFLVDDFVVPESSIQEWLSDDSGEYVLELDDNVIDMRQVHNREKALLDLASWLNDILVIVGTAGYAKKLSNKYSVRACSWDALESEQEGQCCVVFHPPKSLSNLEAKAVQRSNKMVFLFSEQNLRDLEERGCILEREKVERFWCLLAQSFTEEVWTLEESLPFVERVWGSLRWPRRVAESLFAIWCEVGCLVEKSSGQEYSPSHNVSCSLEESLLYQAELEAWNSFKEVQSWAQKIPLPDPRRLEALKV